MRKLISLLIALVVLPLALTACQSGSDATPASNDQPKQVEQLNGRWVADGFIADISGDSIRIDLGDEESSGLYWKGTWSYDGQEIVTSEADTAALSESLLGSQDASKSFTIKSKDEITFPMEIAGTKTVIHLKRA